ncbi:type VI secretion system protein TssL, long form [Pokkaliibacter sp. CJK22405]|uniref:type VI secretion system protein TssL, long form n=1 Tax=Pokkaliibacter sp. CJK22405 TaxID=3384615 RepID=UPI003984C430
MSDSTIIKPRPGGRLSSNERTAARRGDFTSPMGSDDRTVLQQKPAASARVQKLPTLEDNPLVDYAGPMLSLVSHLRRVSHHADVESLRLRCIDMIREYEQALRQHDIATEQREAARYCMCSFIDEVVLNTLWGEQSSWASHSLLSTFHSQTWGGEHFYSLLDDALKQPAGHAQMLELQYLCLSLGFMGKMRVEQQGQEKLERYREQSYQALKSLREERDKALTPNWESAVQKRESNLRSGIPFWVVLAVAFLALLGIYMTFSYRLSQESNGLYANLASLVPTPVVKEATPAQAEEVAEKRDEIDVLRQRLQTEIDRGLVEISAMPDRTRITLGSEAMFASGSADIKEAFMPILSKIGTVLEGTEGRILITGHTDNQPIATSKYPSNWHLSLARATEVSNVLSKSANLQGRLWPEGRGANEPRYGTDTPEEWAKNRRVEIDLLY